MDLLRAALLTVALNDSTYTLLPGGRGAVHEVGFDDKLCYQCPNETYADTILATDPLVTEHTKVEGTCAANGYPIYTINDPYFVDAELYVGRGGLKAVQRSSGNDWNSTCSAPTQDILQYNVNDYTAASVGLPGNPPADETLAEAICCDSLYYGYAEPRGLYAQPDVGLFRKMNKENVTVFYDSVCGIPLFQAPVGRTLEEWQAETKEHGWPSFRPQEVVEGNVLTAADGTTLVSACGTKLGTNEPDEDGDRFCMDLTCIAGSPSQPLRLRASP